MTTRGDVEGTLARWFAVDATGQIGVFTGAYAAWPSVVFTDYSLVEAADVLLDTAVPITVAIASRREIERNRTRPPAPLFDESPTLAMIEASRGLFSFTAEGYGGVSVYELDASPRVPLHISDAPTPIRRAALLVVLGGVNFGDTEEVDIAKHLPIVVGAG